jgi:hypothetical protein
MQDLLLMVFLLFGFSILVRGGIAPHASGYNIRADVRKRREHRNGGRVFDRGAWQRGLRLMSWRLPVSV